MAILGQPIDYTDKDFDSLRARLFNLIGSVFPTWTARQIADFGNILIELFAFVGDVLGKYQDNQSGESRWGTAQQRKNLINLAKLIGFEPATATASQVDVTISIVGGPVAADIIVPAGTVVRTRSAKSPVIFRTLTEVVIPAGAPSIDVTAENSEPQEDVFTSTGTADQEFVLGATPYLDGSAILIAGNGIFEEVENFLDSTSTDKHFTVTVDQNDNATIRTGDGVNGAIPTGTLTASYSTGGGTAGLVEAGKVEVLEGTFFDDDENSVTLSVTNAAESTPASNRQTVEEIREAAPLSIRALNRTVAREDYEINGGRAPGAARLLMLTSDQDGAIGENTGFLYVVPDGGGVPTQALKDEVLRQVTVVRPNTLTFTVNVSDPVYRTVDIYTVVFPRQGVTPAVLDARIRSRLEAFFAIQNADGSKNEKIDFGYYLEEALSWSDVHNEIRDTDGVFKTDPDDGLLLEGVRDDVTLLAKEFPKLGTVTIINGNTGAPLV